MKPLVSVVITSYNYGRYIADAVDSVLRQDYPNFEVVVTDNRSTDDSLAVLARYENDPRVRVSVNPENIGITPNINTGIKLCEGEYIVVLSADDCLLQGHLTKLVAFAQAHPDLAFVYANAVFADGAATPYGLRRVYGQFPGDYVGGRNEFPWLLVACYVCLPTILFPRRLFERFGYFDEKLKIASDWEITTRVAAAGERFGYLAEPLVAVRMHPDQHSTQSYIENGGELGESLTLLERYLRPENAHLYHGYELIIRNSLRGRAERLRQAKLENFTPEVRRRVARLEEQLSADHDARTKPSETPKIGILVTSNGRIALLGTALRSLLAQTYTNWEAVVVQSGGVSIEAAVVPDGARDRIRYVHASEELKPAQARNMGWWMIGGDYFVFFDEDDEFAPEHLGSLVAAVTAEKKRMAASGTVVLFDEYPAPNALVRRTVARAEDLRPLNPQNADIEVANCLPLGAMIFEKTLVDELQQFIEGYEILAEWEYVYRAVAAEPFALTGTRTFYEHAALGMRGQYLAEQRSNYLAKLDALYANHPPTKVGVIELRQNHREALARFLAAPPSAFEDPNNAFALHAALAGLSMKLPV